MLGIIISIANFLSFLSGIVFGIFLAGAGVIYLLRDKNEGKENGDGDSFEKEEIGTKGNILKNKPLGVLPKAEADRLSTIIDILEDLNSPFKNMSPILKKIHQNTKESDVVNLETKMKNIIDYAAISKYEKEFQDTVGELKDHYKQIKLLSSFLNDVSKYFQAFSKDLGKLSNTAKNNLLKSAAMESKQEIIVNNWWQMLMTAFDSLSNDYQDVAGLIGEELLNYSNQIQEEVVSIEKKLSAEGGRQFAMLRDNVSLFESKLKEREKNLEKLKSTPVPAGMTNKLDLNSMNMDSSFHSTTGAASSSAVETYQRRYIRYRTADENLKTQTRRLYEIQKEFFFLFPRYTSDVQLTIVKSIVETQSQLTKFIDGFKKLQRFQHNITNKMQLSLTNAAGSFLQMLKGENRLLFEESVMKEKESKEPKDATKDGDNSPNIVPGKVYGSYALDIMKQNLVSQGVKGYELTLQRVLEGLIVQSQIKDITSSAPPSSSSSSANTVVIGGSAGHGVRFDSNGKEIALSPNGTAGSSVSNLSTAAAANKSSGMNVATDLNGISEIELGGRLNMYTENTACLAAHNPQVLPFLPTSFHQAIGVETCIWFNGFSGRVYRDMANSDYFYHWFCAKLAAMLNKTENKEKLPDYIDKFEVCDVKFGDLPPLLLNMKWSPYRNKRKNPEHAAHSKTSASTGAVGQDTNKEDNKAEEEEQDDDDIAEESSDSEGEGESSPNGAMNEPSGITSTTSTDANGVTTTTSSFTGKTSSGLMNAISKKLKKKSKVKSQKEFQSGKINDIDDQDDESYYYAACTADMAFRSGIKFTIRTRLWINWPRDRYASVPILFHLDLAEMSGRVKFGCKRSCSFFTFMDDPMIRINVRSEVGNAKYKLNDIPQVSEYIVKKLKSFIHRKVVYPHAHRFRLIWPRNWWPEGTENLFLPAAAAAGGLPQHGSNGNLAAMATASTTESNTTATTTDVPAPSASTKKNAAKEEPEDATATRKGRSYSIIGNSTSTAPPVSTSSAMDITNSATTSVKTPPKTADGVPTTADGSVRRRDSTPPGRMAMIEPPQVTTADRFNQHMVKIGPKVSSLASNALLPHQELRRLHQLKMFYAQEREYTQYADLYEYILASFPTTITVSSSQGTTLGRPYAYDDMLLGNQFAKPTAIGTTVKIRNVTTKSGSTTDTNTNKPGQVMRASQEFNEDMGSPRFRRHHSIADFRSDTLLPVLEQEHAKFTAAQALKLESQKLAMLGDAGKVDKSIKDPTRGNKQQLSHVIRRASAMAQRAAHPSSESTSGGSGGGNDEKFSWFSKDGIQKAKAKFNEMKNKHFGNHPDGAGAGTGGNTANSSGSALNTNSLSANASASAAALASKANKFGDKLTELLFAEEEGSGSGSGAPSSSPGTNSGAVRRRGSDDNISVTSSNNNVTVERRDSISSLFSSSSAAPDGRRRRNSLSGREEEDSTTTTSSSGGGSKVSAMKNMMANMFRSNNS